MSFLDNLRQKIAVDRKAAAVIASLKPPGSERHLDRDDMIALLELAGYRHVRRRDLDLYLPDGDPSRNEVLVLDNDLPVYHTTLEDVEMRKSPVVKEMVNLRNIRKILVDTDVVATRQADTVRRIQQICVDRLELDWQPADIRDIKETGTRSLENGYADGVIDSLTLFAELMDYDPPPRALRTAHHDIIGRTVAVGGTPIAYGPIAAFSRIDHRLCLLEDPVTLKNTADLAAAREVITGKAAPAAEGRAVFDWLENAVLASRPA